MTKLQLRTPVTPDHWRRAVADKQTVYGYELWSSLQEGIIDAHLHATARRLLGLHNGESLLPVAIGLLKVSITTRQHRGQRAVYLLIEAGGVCHEHRIMIKHLESSRGVDYLHRVLSEILPDRQDDELARLRRLVEASPLKPSRIAAVELLQALGGRHPDYDHRAELYEPTIQCGLYQLHTPAGRRSSRLTVFAQDRDIEPVVSADRAPKGDWTLERIETALTEVYRQIVLLRSTNIL